jgi:hypothetical protein
MLLLLLLNVAVAHASVEPDCWLKDLVGPDLLGPHGGALTPSCAVSSPLVLLVFASSSCEACVTFSAKLQDLAVSKGVSLVLASRDKSQARFVRHTASSPAWAIPYDSPSRERVNERFQRPPVPTLIAYGADGLELDRRGYFTVQHLGSAEAAIEYWTGIIAGTATPVDHRLLYEKQIRTTGGGGSMQKLVPASNTE